MDAFRAFFFDIGMEACQPHIQSGNFILRGHAELMDEQALADQMRNKLAIETVVFLRNEAQYRTLIDACPYAELSKDHPKKLLVTFFKQQVNANQIATLQEEMAEVAQLYLSTTELYTYLIPEQQYGNFSNNALEKLLQTAATTRNWNTVLKMQQLQHL